MNKTISAMLSAHRKCEQFTVKTYRKIENFFVSTYRRVENFFVNAYKAIEYKFVGCFLIKDGETAETALKRLKGKE